MSKAFILAMLALDKAGLAAQQCYYVCLACKALTIREVWRGAGVLFGRAVREVCRDFGGCGVMGCDVYAKVEVFGGRMQICHTSEA